MLINATTLNDYKLDSIDGEMGKVREFYFDDQHWAIRYLVADTGNWLASRQVLISPYSLGAVSKEEQHIVINLTREQIENSPSLNSDKPVSRQFEEDYYAYYGWPVYWSGGNMWGAYPYIVRDPEKWGASIQDDKSWDPHLRSTHDVTGHHIQSSDGEIGHVEDFIIDDETWAIRYLVIDTRNWWPGKKVLISPEWIEYISWNDSKVLVNLSRETIKKSPGYTQETLINRDYEHEMYRHYNRQGYWIGEPVDTA
ncbi:MAG: PRC-barrel domain-containing protein [Candidatus Thermoplasmatota archaeon]